MSIYVEKNGRSIHIDEEEGQVTVGIRNEDDDGNVAGYTFHISPETLADMVETYFIRRDNTND